MNISAKIWWENLNSTEKGALVAFGVFLAGVAILFLGIKVGQIIATIINML
jgi:hypothetical protein